MYNIVHVETGKTVKEVDTLNKVQEFIHTLPEHERTGYKVTKNQ